MHKLKTSEHLWKIYKSKDLPEYKFVIICYIPLIATYYNFASTPPTIYSKGAGFIANQGNPLKNMSGLNLVCVTGGEIELWRYKYKHSVGTHMGGF